MFFKKIRGQPISITYNGNTKDPVQGVLGNRRRVGEMFFLHPNLIQARA